MGIKIASFDLLDLSILNKLLTKGLKLAIDTFRCAIWQLCWNLKKFKELCLNFVNYKTTHRPRSRSASALFPSIAHFGYKIIQRSLPSPTITIIDRFITNIDTVLNKIIKHFINWIICVDKLYEMKIIHLYW